MQLTSFSELKTNKTSENREQKIPYPLPASSQAPPLCSRRLRLGPAQGGGRGGVCPLTLRAWTAQARGGLAGESRVAHFAREWGAGASELRVCGNGSHSQEERQPGWRLRAGKRPPQVPWPPRELSREAPRRKSRTRKRVRPHRRRCRHCRCSRPGLSLKALSSASRWRTSCEWPEAVPRRGRRAGLHTGGAG